jgi:hypothetical protein
VWSQVFGEKPKSLPNAEFERRIKGVFTYRSTGYFSFATYQIIDYSINQNIYFWNILKIYNIAYIREEYEPWILNIFLCSEVPGTAHAKDKCVFFSCHAMT